MVVGSERISTMDGFFGYNQVKVFPEDQEKTTFTTPWGTFMYAKMPFGLMNVGANFQRAMDIDSAEFDHLWVGPYLIAAQRGDNAFILRYSDESQYEGGILNGRFLKHYLE